MVGKQRLSDKFPDGSMPATWGVIFEEFYTPLKAFFLRRGISYYDAEEYASKTVERAWNKRASYKHTCGKYSTWLFSIGRNLSIDEYRKKMKEAARTTPLEECMQHYNPLENMAETIDRFGLLARMIPQLTPEQKRVLALGAVGYTQVEIAATDQTPLGTVKTRVRIGHRKLLDGDANGIGHNSHKNCNNGNGNESRNGHAKEGDPRIMQALQELLV